MFDDKEHQMPLKKRCPPPYQVLDLVAHYLRPETLAAAACVCKSWSVFMSSDHFWHPFCSAAYPSLSHLRRPTAEIPYSKLYSIGRAADNRRLRKPPKPRLSLNDLVFAVDIQSSHGLIATLVKPVGELQRDKNSVFRFDWDVVGVLDKTVAFEVLDSVRVTWNVVLEGFEAVFTKMDCKGKGSFVVGLEGWFSKELPSSGCCGGGGASGMVADLRLGLRLHGGGVEVEKMSVGVLSIVSWMYMSVDDVLRYLQHFLLN